MKIEEMSDEDKLKFTKSIARAMAKYEHDKYMTYINNGFENEYSDEFRKAITDDYNDALARIDEMALSEGFEPST